MPLTVRPALLRDVPDLADLAARTFPLACPPELARAAVEAFIRRHLDEEAFRGYLDDPAYTVLLARSGDSPAAYALLVDGTAMDTTCAGLLHGRRPLGISKFYLEPSLHGSGAAGLLLKTIIDTARLDTEQRAAADSLWLATNVANTRARRFYARNGFSERGHRTFEVGGTINDDIVYERML